MARPGGVIKRPALPPNLLKELGGSDSNGARKPRNNTITSRKDRRKAERQQKKGRAITTQARRPETITSQRTPPKLQLKPEKPPVPIKSIPGKQGKSKTEPEEDPFADFGDQDDVLSDGILDEGSDDDEDMGQDMEGLDGVDDDDDDEEDDNDGFDDLLGGDDSEDEDEDEGILDEDEDEDDEEEDEDEDEDDEEEDEDEDDEEEDETPQPSRKVSKTIKSKLAEDDAEIADLERRLGIKGKKKGLPKSFLDDGLGDLLGELDGPGEEGGVSSDKRKRKAEADEWLAQKRRKAEAAAAAAEAKKKRQVDSDDEMEGLDSDMEGMDEDSEGLDDDMEGFDEDDEDGFESEEEASEPVKKVRENPYVAPTTGQTAKYVPPSLRRETGSDSELAARVRRQTQGLINRITESNLLTILGEIEKLYREHPRQHVSSSLIDLLLIQVCDPTSLPDTLLILTAGFASAAYKVIGTDLGAQMIQEVVERFETYYAEAKVAALERPDVPKQTSNLITFIAELYNFQMIGHNIVFDYIRMLLDDLSELNAELLLRIVRMCGPTLRQEDPMALKDIVTLIPPAVAKYGEKNLTVRTKFMIETITDLKNNKLKAGAGASAIVSEHLTRMKKTLGQLKSRKLKATEPLRIGLKDIKDADKTGKWWLVGASWAGKDKSSGRPTAPDAEDDESDAESITLDGWDEGPDLLVLAKEQGMNTEVRRSIFVSVLSALDCQDAYLRILKLKLNKERQKEIATVLIRLVGAEEAYNPYYTLVAKKMCENQRQVKWSFQASLWKMFGKLGEAGFVDEEDEEVLDEEEKEKEFSTQRIIGTAKMFGSLIAAGQVGLAALKRLNWYQLQAKTKDWLEIMMNTVLIECQRGKKGEKAEEEIVKLFSTVGGDEAELAMGLQWFLRKVTRKTDLAGGKKETRLVKEGCKMAEAALQAVLSADAGV